MIAPAIVIVEVINSLRTTGKPILRHDNFIAKLEAHPGIAHLSFQGSYFDPTGRSVKCYYLPKREAELMVNC